MTEEKHFKAKTKIENDLQTCCKHELPPNNQIPSTHTSLKFTFSFPHKCKQDIYFSSTGNVQSETTYLNKSADLLWSALSLRGQQQMSSSSHQIETFLYFTEAAMASAPCSYTVDSTIPEKKQSPSIKTWSTQKKRGQCGSLIRHSGDS